MPRTNFSGMFFEVYTDPRKNDWRWRLRADTNQKIMAVSPDGYADQKRCLIAVRHIKRALSVEVVRIARFARPDMEAR